MSSWSYEERVTQSESEEKPTPPEIVDTLMAHQEDGDPYRAAITGNYRPEFDDPVKGTAYLVRGIKKAAHVKGPRPPIVIETLEFIANVWSVGGKYNRPRWWTREDGNFSAARSYVFSEETDPETFFEDPRPEWYKRQQEREADKHEAQVRAAFWDCLEDAKGGVVFAHHGDVAAHLDVEIGPQRVKDYLRDWSAVELIKDPHYEGNGFPRKVFAVKETVDEL